MIETIKCKCCNGTGRVQFSGHIADTLKVLRKCGQPITGAALAKKMGNIKPTAMNNRLAYLENIGLATSSRYGRNRLFSAKNK